ncbi:S ribonuclease [Pyrus ussuriensis x Pyrus communis]|uniref:S ribonuclease n=1 Tax=Pyrus ussuriensis x Pyrus communis TaxID=2448454 RepID=A0A5N5I152_9ROSA|nr:S ribonuclease [Pyrus ussuriensis x Pyrus communis]
MSNAFLVKGRGKNGRGTEGDDGCSNAFPESKSREFHGSIRHERRPNSVKSGGSCSLLREQWNGGGGCDGACSRSSP